MIDNPDLLLEEERAAQFDREEYLADLRELVMTGGQPYIKITLGPEGASIQHQGFDDDFDLAAALQDLALAVADA